MNSFAGALVRAILDTMSRNRARRDRSALPALPLLEVPFRQIRNFQEPYSFLNTESLDIIHNASLDILETIGLDFLDTEVLDIWKQAGAKVDHTNQHVWLDRGLVMQAIATAPPSFNWRARNPAHDLTIGGNHIVFGPCGGMAYVSDLDRGRRPGTMADYENFLKLSQMNNVLHIGSWEQVAPQDVDVNTRHLHRLRSSFRLTDKVVPEAAHGRIIPQDVLAMMRIVFGDLDGAPVTGDVINVNSPLRYDDRMLGGLLSYARAGQVTFITPFILAGAMSPVTMAAALAQQNAEVLAGIALTQIIRPGAPVIYGGFTTNIDMKSGSPSFGTPEGAWALLVGGQLARRYNLPYRGSGSLTNAKVPDAQSAYESLWTLWPAVLAHTNLVMHAAGWIDGGLTASYEKFIIDLENLAMFTTYLEGFDLSAESLALDMIAEVGPGGHHFGTLHTQERYRDAFYTTSLADRQSNDAWIASGSADTAQRANKLWKRMLDEYEAPPLDPAMAEELDDYVARREIELTHAKLYE